MERVYFVMLNCDNNDNITPLMDDNNYVARFEYPQIAEEAGEKSDLGIKFGFAVFEVYGGILSSGP